MESNTIKEHFDVYAKSGDWSKLYSQPPSSANWSFFIRKIRVLELIDEPSGRILDIGCGPGIMIRELVDRNYEYFGVDISEEMINEAKAKFLNAACAAPKICLEVGDASNIDYPDEYFDGITGMGLLEYFTEFDKPLKEINRVLRTGGFLIVTVPKRYQLERFMVFALAPLRFILAPVYHRVKKIKPRRVKRTYFSPAQLDVLMNKSGFEKVDFAHYNFTLIPYPFTVLFPRLSHILNSKLERHYKAAGLSLLSTGYIAKYKKLPRTEAR